MGQAEVEFEGQRKEPGNTLLAFDGKAHPRPLQEVSDASAPGTLCADQQNVEQANVRFLPTADL
jgi:hypothetical protein